MSSRRTAPADITAAVIASFERSGDERLGLTPALTASASFRSLEQLRRERAARG